MVVGGPTKYKPYLRVLLGLQTKLRDDPELDCRYIPSEDPHTTVFIVPGIMV